MPDTRLNLRNAQDISHPTCNVCGSKMWLLRITTTLENMERRTFACPVCEVSEPSQEQR